MPAANPQIEQDVERRQSSRTMVQLAATAREPGQEKVPIQIVDISPDGCRIEMVCRSFGEQWILVTIPGLTPVYSRIVWQEQGFAGVEFGTPLNQAVFDSLVEQVHTTKHTISSLRGIGTRAQQVAKRTVESPGKRGLLEISRDCFAAAIVKTFEVLEAHTPELSQQSSESSDFLDD